MGVIGKTVRFTLGLALGAGIGAVAALLVAPQSGKVSREQIQARIDEMVNAGKAAQAQREKELLDYWEDQLALKDVKDVKDTAKK
jgi:gas vesicle protein